jgi:Aspartyl protease
MSLIKCLLFASLLSQAASAAQGEASCPGNVASLPLRLVQSSLIVVPVEVNHSGPFDFLVDTGAQVSTIDSSLASELKLKSQGTVGVGGASTFSRNGAVFLDLVKVGDHSVSHSLAVMQDLAQLMSADQRIRGILGGSFLEHFDLLIDNDQRLLWLTVLPPQEVRIGKVALKQVSFVVPMHMVRQGPAPREDGLLPTMAYQRVFISSSRGFVTLEPRSWNRACSSSMLRTMSLSQGTPTDSRRSASHAEPYGRRELQASQKR